MSMVISVLSSKGGVGKSTTVINLARAIQKDGASVGCIDADPQATLTDFITLNSRNHGDGFFPVVQSNERGLELALKGFADKEVILIDGSPRLEMLAAAILKVTNVVLIPITPSVSDYWSVLSFIELIKARQLVDKNLKAMFVINKIKPNTNAAKEVREALSESGITVLDSGIGDRSVFVKALGNGITVFEEKNNSKAVSEILRLMKNILAEIGNE